MWFIAATSHRVAGIEIFSIPATYVRTTYVGLALICELGFRNGPCLNERIRAYRRVPFKILKNGAQPSSRLRQCFFSFWWPVGGGWGS